MQHGDAWRCVAMLGGRRVLEIFGLLPYELRLHGPFWDFVTRFDINKAGFTIAALFVVVWACALVIRRLGNFESRWNSAGPAGPEE